jgi:RNA recognition motif-containing protein
MKSLFVGNMSFQTTEGDLRTLFEPFGQITRVHMAMDRETGRARGFAFIEMPNDEEAAKAMAGLDGKELGGRNLKVNEARPKGEARKVTIMVRAPVADRTLVVDPVVAAAEAVAKAAAEDATASRTKITANLSGSRANRAGSLHVA